MKRVVVLLALAACGDEIHVETALEPQSGTRLKLEKYRFEDGTEQVEQHSFYDVEMHARCAPQTYVDGSTRCVPFADDALYIDPTCETAVGRAVDPAITEPTHFVGHDRVAGEAAVAHVIVNRSNSPKFPDSVCAVIAQGCQFSYRCDGRSDALSDPRSRARAYRAAEAVLAGTPDPTGGALFFHSARAKPGWFAKRKRTGTIGGNVFYR